MRLSWFMTVRSFLLSVILHIVLIGLLVISIDLTPVPKPPPKVNIVKAVSVDKQQVQRELEKIRRPRSKNARPRSSARRISSARRKRRKRNARSRRNG